jgi:phosphoglycolate phosphatase-like HAD superfamily hydrolase
MSNSLTIGIDFDNTLVCYNNSILKLAEQNFSLTNCLTSKVEIKSFIINKHGGSAWTKFQGELYGPGMQYAEPYENAVETISELTSIGAKVLILSHRTKYPYAGERYDLHKYAKAWIRENLKLKEKNVLDETSAFFFENKAEKIKAIEDNACDFFLDDLVEIIGSKDFPVRTRGILFDNEKKNIWSPSISNWNQLKTTICKNP